jgi:hypothetical protein
MPSAKEISEQVASEEYRRSRLAVPAFAGGFLYLLGGIVASSTLKGAPTVGLLQGLAPAFRGEVNPAESPRAAEVKFISHHAFALIAGSTLSAIAVVVLTLVLLLLVDATRFRRPNSWSAARPLVLVGGIGLAVLTVGHQAISSIETHSFAVGHDLSSHAVDQALTKGTANEITEYLDLLAGLSLMAAVIGVSLGALRVGLLPRWMGILGCFTGVLIFLPLGGATLEVVPSFWLVMMGILYVGKWPNGEPPAWEAGEARPWPTQAERRAEYAEQRAAKQAGKGQPALSAAGADIAPAPAQPASSGRSRKRRRKRGARG